MDVSRGRYGWEDWNIPTALSSMMPWALVFAADMAAGLTLEPKILRRNEMVGSGSSSKVVCSLTLVVEEE